MTKTTSSRLSPVIVFLLLCVNGCTTSVKAPPAEDRAIKQEVVYEVKRGDQLGSIAERVTGQFYQWSAIAAHNGISDPRTLAEGQILRIPIALVKPELRSPIEPDATTTVREKPSLGDRASSPISVTPGNAVSVTGAASSSTDYSSDITVSSIKVNRSFELEPLDTSMTSDSEPGDRTVAPRIKVSGTYFPKGIYQGPADYARLIQRAAPGTIFPLERKVNDWYKIVTDEGVGYIRESDSLLIE
ncbi:MAG: LysM peptidoglycan-binding domain-containing protein [Granulosicoccus sp.]